MIRPFTVVCMLMAVGSGLYLYQCKHQAQVLDREIALTLKQTEAARDRIGMLRAEWAQLNEPERLADLARAHSALQTAKPTQFIAANDLANRLPAPVAPNAHPLGSTDVPEDTDAAAPAAQAEPPPPPAAAAPRVATVQPAEPRPVAHPPIAAEPRPTQTATVDPHPAATATPSPDAKPGHHVATASSTATAPTGHETATHETAARDTTVHEAPVHEVPAQVAAVRPPARPIVTPRAVSIASAPVSSDAVAPGTVGAAVLRAMRARAAARPMHEGEAHVEPAAAPAAAYSPPRYTPPAYAPQPAAAPSYAPQAYAAPVAGSMLGGARSTLPPPVPFAAR